MNDEQVDRAIGLGLASGAVIHSLATLVLGPWAWLATVFVVLSVHAVIRRRPSALVAVVEPKRIAEASDVLDKLERLSALGDARVDIGSVARLGGRKST